MKKIALISDTHGTFPERIFELFKDVDEIWHAGDIGPINVTDRLKKFKPLRAVFGNIDDFTLRSEFPEYLVFTLEGVKFVMLHIAGKIGKWSMLAKKLIQEENPDVLICGHSHILKVEKDKNSKLIYINPGAAGQHGFHRIITAIRMEVADGRISKLEVVEFGKRGEIRE